MKKIQFDSALVGTEWHDDVVLSIEQGRIVAIDDSDSMPVDERVPAVALPGMVNVHSHAFQRAFAGLSEFHTAERDSFWTWRSLMFDFLLRFTPGEIYEVAKQLYVEMLNAGYTWVGEFHYVHNDRDGRPYPRMSELADAIRRAAADAGIGLCLLPTLYQRGGFKNEGLTAGQKRFAMDAESFVELVGRCREYIGQQNDYQVGVAIHSLRAVAAEVGNDVLAVLKTGKSFPIHMHVAEQLAEVKACQEVEGKRSVEFLFERYAVDENWCLIHATHLNDWELQAIAKSQAVVGLCPTTEANLGDGIFRMPEFCEAGGRFAIGGDSHMGVDLREELRLIEYAQRLSRRERVVLGPRSQSSGRFLYEQAARGGAAALGIGAGVISVGERADLTLIDQNSSAIDGAQHDRLLDRLVFCNPGGNPIAGTMVGGKLRMKGLEGG